MAIFQKNPQKIQGIYKEIQRKFKEFKNFSKKFKKFSLRIEKRQIVSQGSVRIHLFKAKHFANKGKVAFARLKGKVKQRLQGYKICKAVNSAFARIDCLKNAKGGQRWLI